MRSSLRDAARMQLISYSLIPVLMQRNSKLKKI